MKLNWTLVFFFHWWFIVDRDSEFPRLHRYRRSLRPHWSCCAAATCRHGTDRRRRFFELGLLLRYLWLAAPPSHCYSSTALTWPWWWSRCYQRLKISWFVCGFRIFLCHGKLCITGIVNKKSICGRLRLRRLWGLDWDLLLLASLGNRFTYHLCVTGVTEWSPHRMTKSHSVWVPTETFVTTSIDIGWQSRPAIKQDLIVIPACLILATYYSVISMPDKITEYCSTRQSIYITNSAN